MEWIVLGEALLTNIELDSSKLNDAIVEVNQKKLVLKDEKKNQKQLENMQKMNGNPFWSKPIIHPNAHVNYDSPTFFVIKPYGFYLWGFHCNDKLL